MAEVKEKEIGKQLQETKQDALVSNSNFESQDGHDETENENKVLEEQEQESSGFTENKVIQKEMEQELEKEVQVIVSNTWTQASPGKTCRHADNIIGSSPTVTSPTRVDLLANEDDSQVEGSNQSRELDTEDREEREIVTKKEDRSNPVGRESHHQNHSSRPVKSSKKQSSKSVALPTKDHN
ncbi:hypothetical protein F2Q69_00034977 [Brassica cretica]|uniref:Uncharacterized protein n=1 Tax=Brassica cretica TaxID=69181 RepID=A0A8S9SE90_BRACR|nr:hypothetical protein F2Q69_00034977 [Brassica cretica]